METIYRAIDGTEFTNKQECINHEKRNTTNYQKEKEFKNSIEKIGGCLGNLFNLRFQYKQTDLPYADKCVKNDKEKILKFLKKVKRQGVIRTLRNRRALQEIADAFRRYNTDVLELKNKIQNFSELKKNIRTEQAKLFKLKSDYKKWLEKVQAKDAIE